MGLKMIIQYLCIQCVMIKYGTQQICMSAMLVFYHSSFIVWAVKSSTIYKWYLKVTIAGPVYIIRHFVHWKLPSPIANSTKLKPQVNEEKDKNKQLKKCISLPSPKGKENEKASRIYYEKM